MFRAKITHIIALQTSKSLAIIILEIIVEYKNDRHYQVYVRFYYYRKEILKLMTKETKGQYN